jgi:hypothetical protein
LKNLIADVCLTIKFAPKTDFAFHSPYKPTLSHYDCRLPFVASQVANLAGVPLGHDLGWSAVLDKMMTAMVNAGFDITRDKVVRSKEKFGCLSLDVDIDQSFSGDDLRRTSINEAIRLSNNSARVCEVCGEAGHQLVSGSCRMARCAEHAPEGTKTLREHYARSSVAKPENAPP